MRPRLRRFELLEPRRMLTAAYINELLFSPLFGNSSKDQYVELRGEPHAMLDSGTYLVVVESDKTLSNDEGRIHGIFDLSGLAFGSNGFLVLLQQDSPFSPDPRANTLQSTEPEFGGLPGDRYSDSHSLSERIDFIYRSNTFFLIQTDVVPSLGDDIDTDSDGYIDEGGIVDQWDVLDSVSTMSGLTDGHAYGQIVFVDSAAFDPAITVAPDATRVDLDGTGYVARIGNSTGSAAEDWVGGVVKDLSGDDLFMRFAGDVHGRPRPIVFHGRELDSLGSENFTAAVRAQIFEDLDSDGILDPSESPLSGIQVLADTNGNGTRDLLTTVVEPDDFEQGIQLNNLTPGVTLSTAIEENVVIGFDVEAKQDFWATARSHHFAHEGIDFFNTVRRLRMDFYRPAQSVSIDVIGNSDFTPTYGRLEVFDAEGNSLRMVRSNPLDDDVRERLTIDMSDDVIAYAVAYSDDDYLDSSPFGKFDSLAFTVPEVVSATDAEGRATLNYLDPGDYVLRGLADGAVDHYLLDPLPIQIERYENFQLSIAAVLNEPPVITAGGFSIAENSPGGTVVGRVEASDMPSQSVEYTLIEGQDQFAINAANGQLRVKNEAVLNYEDQSIFTIRVRATDNAPIPLSSESELVVRVTDVNEPPSGGTRTFEIVENSAAGTVVGAVATTDPDAGVLGLAGYRISGTNPNGAFAIDAETGQLSVNNPGAFDFEGNRSMTLTVVAFDGGTPSLSSPLTITVNVTDVNEPPRLLTEEFVVGELVASGALLGRIQASDPENSQPFRFAWGEGFETELFELNPITGGLSIAAGAQLDYATAAEHLLPVRVSDSGVPPQSSTATVRVRVVDQNNPPQILDSGLTIEENAIAGAVVGTVAIHDPDAGSVETFEILGGTGAGLFTIHSTSGEVRVAAGAELDFESANAWEVTVRVTDNGQPVRSTTRTLPISIIDANESPAIDVPTLAVAENAAGGDEIGQIGFSDPDGGDALTITLLDSPAAARFTIDAATGVLRVREGVEFDFETETVYALSVAVSDGHHPPVTADLVVTVLDVNEAPTAAGEIPILEMVAGESQSYEIPLELFSEVDAGQSLSLTVASPQGGLPEWVQFDPHSKMLSAAPWNAETGEHLFVLRAIDNGSPPLSGEIAFSIHVTANAALWHNSQQPADVNGDGRVQPLDALVIINYLNRGSVGEVSLEVRSRTGYFDVNGNNLVEPLDALRIINLLNRQAGGEGEALERATPADLAGFDAQRWVEEERLRRSQIADAALLEYVRSTHPVPSR